MVLCSWFIWDTRRRVKHQPGLSNVVTHKPDCLSPSPQNVNMGGGGFSCLEIHNNFLRLGDVELQVVLLRTTNNIPHMAPALATIAVLRPSPCLYVCWVLLCVPSVSPHSRCCIQVPVCDWLPSPFPVTSAPNPIHFRPWLAVVTTPPSPTHYTRPITCLSVRI